jgi:pilus assembly protein CpaE
MAHYAARAGSRILLADLDPLEGTIGFYLKLISTCSFIDFFEQPEKYKDDDAFRSCVVGSEGLDVLLAPELPVEHVERAVEATPVMLSRFRSRYDLSIVDCGGPFGALNLALAQASDEILLLTTLEVPVLRKTRRALSYLDRRGVNASAIHLTVRETTGRHGFSSDALAQLFGMPVFATVASDPAAVERAWVLGRPVDPYSKFGKTVAALTNQLSSGNKVRGRRLLRTALTSVRPDPA